ncbi:hypothetical protein [Streptomyces albicerus]|uniref:hypothetical protein n=1 Tax=Streptomyces albicerus TaxID=2569859 RepID=UPI00124AE614|nr:hypothetical protein [Streptomyces albicerus]
MHVAGSGFPEERFVLVLDPADARAPAWAELLFVPVLLELGELRKLANAALPGLPAMAVPGAPSLSGLRALETCGASTGRRSPTRLRTDGPRAEPPERGACASLNSGVGHEDMDRPPTRTSPADPPAAEATGRTVQRP